MTVDIQALTQLKSKETMQKQEPHSDHISSSRGGETPQPRTEPDQGGSRIDTAAKNKQAEEGDKDGIGETVKHAGNSELEHQRGHGTGRSLTHSAQKSREAPEEGERRLYNSVTNHADREITKSPEPMDDSMAPGVKDPTIANGPLKRPPGLTQTAEFWKRYDRLADLEDQKLSRNLNGNLDVLLIFAALFSAVNTAFISMTMPSLSPDPLDKTNALLELLVKRVDNSTLRPSDLTPPFSPQVSSIAVNFLLYGSLCCSLLAAMGAMLGKEWLQSFDRSGQTGPLEEQGRFRQRKFNGILQWHLEGTILFLPNLLLFSVTLFFAALALYLFPINKVVAGLLITVLGVSAGVWQVTVLAGAIWPLCPYQSAVSRAFRLIGLLVATYWARVRWPGGPIQLSSKAAQSTKIRKEEATNELRAKEEQVSNAQAALWLIKTTSSWEDRVAAAEFIATFDKVLGCASVLQDQGNWQRLFQSIQEAFENWHYQPNSANWKIVQSFGRALSHMGLLRPENAVKWRFWAEGKPGQVHGVSKHFMHGLDTASRRTNNHDTDWELLVYAASLYTLAATGNIYTRSRSWERLFMLMGNFDFNLLDLQITSAFWNAAHRLLSLPESHPETSAFEVYSSFLQEIRHVATPDKLPGDLVSLLTYSVVEFIFDFNESFGANPDSPNLKLDKFLGEALLSIRAIFICGSFPTASVQDRYREFRRMTSWQSPKRTWDYSMRVWKSGDIDEFWRALDRIIIQLTNSPPEIKELTVDFVLVAVERLSISLPSLWLKTGLERFPQIPTFITLSLAEGNPTRQARGLNLFLFNFGRWMKYAPRSLERVWIEVGLVAKLVGMVQEPQTWSSNTRLLVVLKAMTDNFRFWSGKLVEAGFVPAASKAILHIDKARERLHPEWRDILRRALAITLEVWDNTNASRPSSWEASEIILMVRHSSAHVEVSLNSEEEKPLHVGRLVGLINHLYKSRPSSAFISCNADVAVRSLFCELRRRVEGKRHQGSNAGLVGFPLLKIHVDGRLRDAYWISQRINWDYVHYVLPEPPVLCSRPDFLGTQML